MNSASVECTSRLIQWSGRAPDLQSEQEDGWVSVSWTVERGETFDTSCLLFLPKTDRPFWCIPGLFWGDNQQDTTGQYYPRFRGDLDRPRRFESRFWEFHVWRAAQPVTAMHDGASWWVLEVEPTGRAGENFPNASVGFEYENEVPVLVASLPPKERPYRPVGHDYTMPRTGEWRFDTSQLVTWRVRALRVEGGLPAILEVLGENYRRERSVPEPNEASKVASAARNALIRWHYDPEASYFRYTVAFDRVGQQLAEAQGASLDRHEMAIGWVSGWVVFEALIEWAARQDDLEALTTVNQCWRKLMAAQLVSPSGFWWTRYAPHRGQAMSLFESKLPGGMDGNWMPDPHHLHLRTLGDAVLRAARILGRHGEALSFADELREQVVQQARQVARLAERGWPLPLSVDARTGEPAGLRGTAGMIWISVWSELAKQGLWQNGEIIREGADHYRSAVASGQLHGAPEDVGECVTSEDIYIAIDSYLDAFRTTGRREDLETCQQAARWLYLWRKSFTHRTDNRTLIGIYNLKSRGGDFASFKNNHLHVYGLDAEESMLELAEITGDPRFRELADDHWAFAAQLTPLVDGQFNAFEGMVTEQFYFADWSALGNSVRFLECDDRKAAFDVGQHFRNHGNVAGFSHAWCTAFILKIATSRMQRTSLLIPAASSNKGIKFSEKRSYQ